MEQTQPTFTPVEMADGNNKYATHGMGTAGVTLGSIATALAGALTLNNGGLGGLFGGPRVDYVPRAEANLMQEVAAKNAEIAKLEAVNIANAKTDEVRKELQTQITVNKDLQAQVNLQQATVNATQTGLIAGLQAQLAQLQSCFHMMIPASNVVPAPTTAAAGA